MFSLQASPTEEDICCTAPQGVGRAALCECALDSHPSCLESVTLKAVLSTSILPSTFSPFTLQHGTGWRAGLQHLSDESERPQPVRRPAEPPAERGPPAEHHPAGGRRRSLRQPRPAAH